MSNILLTPHTLGALELPNRIIMAPMTRNRADENGIPHPAAASYYAQRATAGLIISEANAISRQGYGYEGSPGMWSATHVESWRGVTRAVHNKGGRIFAQLFHVGRISHPDLQPGNELPVSASAIAAGSLDGTYDGAHNIVIPRALEIYELAGIVEQFKVAAGNALEAGFDGVEIHGANGYLLDQFLQDISNHRQDDYGKNRSRLLLEVVAAVTQIWNANRVGVRISPSRKGNGMGDSDPATTFHNLAKALSKTGIAYLHIVEPHSPELGVPASSFRPHFLGTIIANGGYEPELAREVVSTNNIDLIAFARWYISNPDLVERIGASSPLATVNDDTVYGGDERGYTDYPPMN